MPYRNVTPHNIRLSSKDQKRLAVIRQVFNGKLTQKEASNHLDLSIRQVKRLCKKIRAEGDPGIMHGLIGRPSNHRIKPHSIERMVAELKRYQAREKLKMITPAGGAALLRNRFSLWISRYPLRRILTDAGLWKPGYQIVRRRRGRGLVEVILKPRRKSYSS